MNSARIFWITSEKFSGGYIHELPVISEMRRLGVEVIPTVWNRQHLPDLGPQDFIIIRSPWDYLENYESFAEWVEGLPEERVFNSRAILKWNLDKTYLRQLEKGGIPLVPTKWVTARDESEVRLSVETAFPGRPVVIKPLRGAGGAATYRLSPGEFPPVGVYPGRSALIQPFLPEIVRDGEYSLIYFAGKISHSVVKLPVPGDFRVQESFGGKILLRAPTRSDLEFGKAVLRQLQTHFPAPELPLYARVDFVRVDGDPLLMELELLEPDLYFHHAPEAAGRFVEALTVKLCSVSR